MKASAKVAAIGRWTALFGPTSSFCDEIAKAVEVRSDLRLREIEGLGGEFSCVEILLPDLPGRDEYLWASDKKWLYVRRPEGVWKTGLPIEHLDRICVLRQLAASGKTFGGMQLGRDPRDCSNLPGWRRRREPTTLAAMDFPYGLDEAGNEIGPTLSEAVEVAGGRVVMRAGPNFPSRPTRGFGSETPSMQAAKAEWCPIPFRRLSTCVPRRTAATFGLGSRLGRMNGPTRSTSGSAYDGPPPIARLSLSHADGLAATSGGAAAAIRSRSAWGR